MPLVLGFNTSPRDVQYCSFHRLRWSKALRAWFRAPVRGRSKELAVGGLVSERSPLIMRAPPFRYRKSSLRAWMARRSGVRILGLPAGSGWASLFNNLSQATCVGARKSNSARAYADGCLHPEV